MSQVHVSHSGCKHAKTPKERAKCRKIRNGGAPEATVSQLVKRAKAKKTMTPREQTATIKKAQDEARARTAVEAKRLGSPAPAPKLRELLTIDDDTVIPGLDGVTVGDVRHLNGAEVAAGDLSDVPCDDDTIDVIGAASAALTATVQAKGSKVVHQGYTQNDAWHFACTKQPVNAGATKGWANAEHPVTCKNCLKLA